MRGIVLPAVTASPIATDVCAIATLNICIAVEVVIHIDVDITASPATAPTPAATPRSTHRQANAE